MKRRRTDSDTTMLIFLKIAVISGLSGITVFFCMSSLIACVLFIADIPYGMYKFFSEMIIIVSSFYAGRSGGFLRRKKGMATGVMCSFSILMAAFLIFLLSSESADVLSCIFTVFIAVLSGAVGGIYGVNRHISGKPIIYFDEHKNE